MKSLVGWVLFSKLLVVAIILYAGIGLMPDEAQYWTWSKELSYGYYSKPPGIAWQIKLGTMLFGDSEFGVRFVSVLFSSILSFALYALARASAFSHSQSFWAAICFSYSPLGIFSGFFATTDCSYVLFWTLACLLVARGTSLVWVGLVIGLGALWKWPIYLLWLPVAVFYYKKPRELILGVATSLLGLLPSLIWNMQTGFVTFSHVAASIDNPSSSSANPIQFLLAQLALVSPLLFLLLTKSMWQQRGKNFLWVASIVPFTLVFGASFFEKVQGNWAVAAYPTAFVIMASCCSPRWMRYGCVVSVILVVAVLVNPVPFKPGLGFYKVEQALIEAGYVPERDFLFSGRYQATSLLSFYGPEQKRAYFLNINALRHNQFDLWPGMDKECLHKTGYFVEIVSSNEEERLKERLKPYFDDVVFIKRVPLYKEKTAAIILRATGYNGKVPPAVNKY